MVGPNLWGHFKELLKKFSSVPKTQTNNMEKKVSIVVGHTKKKPGACGLGIECEWEFNKKVAEHLKDICDIYYYDNYNSGYTAMVKRNATLMNMKNYTLNIELHYNYANFLANGCETLYYFPNMKGKQLAQEFSKLISKTFRVKNRGVKALANENDRGFAAVYYPRATTLLVEPFFGSSPEDVARFYGKEKEYADTIRKFLKDRYYV